MIIRLYNLDNKAIDYGDGNVVTIEVEDAHLFSKMLQNLSIDDMNQREIAIDNDDKLVIAKDIVVLYDFINIDNTAKTILTKLYKYIELNFNQNYDKMLLYREKTNELMLTLIDLVADIDIDFNYSQEVEVKDMLALMKLVPIKSELSYFENLLQLLNLTAELKLAKLIVFVNAKSYLNQSELLELFKTAQLLKVKILLMESKHIDNLLNYEKKVFVDSDFCDIIYM